MPIAQPQWQRTPVPVYRPQQQALPVPPDDGGPIQKSPIQKPDIPGADIQPVPLNPPIPSNPPSILNPPITAPPVVAGPPSTPPPQTPGASSSEDIKRLLKLQQELNDAMKKCCDVASKPSTVIQQSISPNVNEELNQIKKEINDLRSRPVNATIDAASISNAIKSDPELINLLKGPKGDKGDTGLQGKTGQDATPDIDALTDAVAKKLPPVRIQILDSSGTVVQEQSQPLGRAIRLQLVPIQR